MTANMSNNAFEKSSILLDETDVQSQQARLASTQRDLADVSIALMQQNAVAVSNLSSKERDVTGIISQAILETETHGFSLSRQLAFVQFLTSLKDLDLALFPDLILKGMLNLIVTIVRMHCSANHLMG